MSKTADTSTTLATTGSLTRFTPEELAAMAEGLQTFGFAEKKKIAELIGTKNENAVNCFIDAQYQKIKVKTMREKGKRFSVWNNPSEEDLRKWPTIRKWNKMASNQVMPTVRRQDYSRRIIRNLCQKFYEEEAEPSNPQVVNTKAMYKYLVDCVSGQLPAQLPPLESLLMSNLLSQLEELKNKCDFSEEMFFIQAYKKAHTFRPFEVKDEFRKKETAQVETIKEDPDAIPVVEEVFGNLSRHRKLMQSFNPLVVPVWLLEKEQMQFQQLLEEILPSDTSE